MYMNTSKIPNTTYWGIYQRILRELVSAISTNTQRMTETRSFQLSPLPCCKQQQSNPHSMKCVDPSGLPAISLDMIGTPCMEERTPPHLCSTLPSTSYGYSTFMGVQTFPLLMTATVTWQTLDKGLPRCLKCLYCGIPARKLLFRLYELRKKYLGLNFSIDFFHILESISESFKL